MSSEPGGPSVRNALEASLGAPFEPAVPPHLAQGTWLDFEVETLMHISKSLNRELRRIDSKVTATRVHNCRVVLRRWSSVWRILARDGFESKRISKRVSKKLQKLSKVLGRLRDWDVNIALGKKMGVSPVALGKWQKEQKRQSKVVRIYIKKLDVDQVLEDLDKFIAKRKKKLSKQLSTTSYGQENAYHHLERYLVEQEKTVFDMERRAKKPPELHELRLAVKAWRYFLAEFFGLTSLGLYKTQQNLGKFNDLTRLDGLLEDSEEKEAHRAIKKLGEEVLAEFAKSRRELPFGLRPLVLSLPMGS